MTVYLSPVGGAGAQFFSNNGVPLSGGKIYTYAAGTTTPQATYTTSAGNAFHTNPIVLDAAGRVQGTGEIWLKNATSYKFTLKSSTDVPIATWDNISGIGVTIYAVQNFNGDGSTVSFTLATSLYDKNLTFVFINGVYQQKNTYSILGTTLLFSQAPPITSSIEVTYI